MDWKHLFLSFDGRINRAKFWAGVGVLFGISIVLMILDRIMGLQVAEGIGILGLIFALVSLYPAFALYAKRWHDRDKVGWWTLILLVPFIGVIWMLVECGFLVGTRADNRFGPDPLA